MRNRNTILWLFIDILNFFVGNTLFVVVSFLLWENGASISTILEYNFFLFLFTALGIILGGEFLVFIPVKRLFQLGIFTRIGLGFFMYFNAELIADNFIPVALLLGLSSSFFWNSAGLLGELLVPGKELITFASVKDVIISGLSIGIPFFVNAVFTNLGPQNYLLMVIGMLSFVGIFSAFLKNVKPANNKSILDVFAEWRSQKAVRDIGYINLAFGLGTAFSVGILDILILEQLQNLDNWSYFSFILALLGIFISSQLKKVRPEEKGKIRFLISFSLLTYAAIPILLYSYFNLYVFLGFIMAKVLYDKISVTVLTPYLLDVQHNDYSYEKKKVDYRVFQNFMWVLGRILPIGILILIPEEFMSVDFLLYTLIAITFIPLYFASRLKTRYKNVFDDF